MLDLLTRELAQPEGTVRNPRRNGKIARLPAATRDILNRMLDDGLPYKVILDELGPHGQGLNTQNITNWVHGGYQDYLAHQAALDRARAQIEVGLELVKEFEDIDIASVRRACNYVAAVQLLEALSAHGDETLKNLFQNRPDKYLNAINTLCRQSNVSIKVEKVGLKQLESGLRLAQSSPIKPNQGVARNPDNCNLATASQPHPRELPSSPIKPNQGAAGNLDNCNLNG